MTQSCFSKIFSESLFTEYCVLSKNVFKDQCVKYRRVEKISTLYLHMTSQAIKTLQARITSNSVVNLRWQHVRLPLMSSASEAFKRHRKPAHIFSVRAAGMRQICSVFRWGPRRLRQRLNKTLGMLVDPLSFSAHLCWSKPAADRLSPWALSEQMWKGRRFRWIKN